MSTTAIRAALRTVAELREEETAAKDALKIKQLAFVAQNRALIEHGVATTKAVNEAEAAAKALLVAHYQATKEKKPVTGGEVKIHTEYAINGEEALAWAREKKLCLIPERLDEAALLTIAKVMPLPFVTKTEVPQPQIAKALSLAQLAEPVVSETPPAPLTEEVTV